ncbi:hypothetical protein Tco_0268269 [Tanacetum coccineum]
MSIAIYRPANNASYSTSLLVVSNLNLRAYVYSFPSGLTSIRPVPEPYELEASSVYKFYMLPELGALFATFGFLVYISLSSTEGVSARKSTMICPLTELRPLNSMSCSPISMAHLAILPDFSSLARIFFMGLSVNTLIRTTLILSIKAARYITNTSPLIGALLRALKNGSDLSAPFERNWLSAASFLLRLCISLSVLGGLRPKPVEGLLDVHQHVFFKSTLNHHVVNVRLEASPNLIVEHLIG